MKSYDELREAALDHLPASDPDKARARSRVANAIAGARRDLVAAGQSLLDAAVLLDEFGDGPTAVAMLRARGAIVRLVNHVLSGAHVPSAPHCPHCCAVLEETHGREVTDADA